MLEFLNFYSKKFNNHHPGISTENVDKHRTINIKEKNTKNKYSIYAESFLSPYTYIGEKCFRYSVVKNTFETTYNKLNSDLENDICSYIKSLDFPCVY